MSEHTTTQRALFPGIFKQPVVAKFDQVQGSSDGGAILLKAADRRLGIAAKFPTSNVCLAGANIEPFWVLQKVRHGYRVVLEVSAHDLQVLRTRWKGYRKIKLIFISLAGIGETTLRFDGHIYRAYPKEPKRSH